MSAILPARTRRPWDRRAGVAPSRFRRSRPRTDDEPMARRGFEVSATLSAAPHEVIDLLMDLSQHGGLHPFLVSARVEESGTSAEGAWWRWRVVERPMLGPLHYRLWFPVRMTRTSAT